MDYGVYLIEKSGEDNRKSISTFHDWVFNAVENHTNQTPKRKSTCVRVIFADGHHVDLPIYYKDDEIELAHRSQGWIFSDPKEFYEWFNGKKNAQLERIVRYLKGWKNFRQIKNTNLKLPSGFELTILAVENYVEDDNDDVAFRETVRAIFNSLSDSFECIRPTTPSGEDVFEDYSETRKENFLTVLESLINDLDRADNEKNFQKASKILINNQFGDRFPKGADKDEEDKSNSLKKSIGSATISPKPYAS